MGEARDTPSEPPPTITKEQLAELRARLAASGHEPVLPVGSITVCPECGGRMVTTNDLERVVATPGVVYVVPRLPGARCTNCKSTELDAAGAAILETGTPRALLADYETAVTHSSGATLGTYFKQDLARVMGLTGRERLSWKVVDRDQALVRVYRGEVRAPRTHKVGKSKSQTLASGQENPNRRRKKLRARA